MKHTVSFKHAWDGIVYTLRTQPNFRIHVSAAIAVLTAAFFFNVHYIELVILLFTIAFVIIAEMINTSIESMTDLITKEHRKQAKVAKDVSAGMVLVSAFFAVFVGIAVFTPYLIKLLN